jgi:hypothetical protein
MLVAISIGLVILLITRIKRITRARLDTHPKHSSGFTGAHETVHLIQVGNRTGQSSKFPAWYREGSASVGAGLVMVAMPDYANGDYNAVDDWELNSWSKQRCGAVFNTWKEKHDESGHAAMKNCEYSVGRRMVEYLVARDKSFDNIFKVYSAVGPIYDI